VVKWKQAEYMRTRIGEEFSGHVSGVVAFGVFVELEEVFVEGLVHVSDLADDYYRYDETGHRLVGERRGRVIRLGDPLQVRVKGINEELMEVNLEPLPQSPEPERRARGRRPESPKEGRSPGKGERPRRKPGPRQIRVRKVHGRGPHR
jgi:ribonuclease R